jgi:hypothetical protein
MIRHHVVIGVVIEIITYDRPTRYHHRKHHISSHKTSNAPTVTLSHQLTHMIHTYKNTQRKHTQSTKQQQQSDRQHCALLCPSLSCSVLLCSHHCLLGGYGHGQSPARRGEAGTHDVGPAQHEADGALVNLHALHHVRVCEKQRQREIQGQRER